MKRILVFGLLLLALAVFTNPARADMVARSPTGAVLVIHDTPCDASAMDPVFERIPNGVALRPLLRAATLTVAGKNVEACWLLHVGEEPHVDVLVEDGTAASVPVTAFTEEAPL